MQISTLPSIRIRAWVVLLLAGLCTGCYKPVLQSPSPDKKHFISIEESCAVADCGVRVVATVNGREKVVALESDCSLLLASIVWSEDSAKAGILVGNNYCANMYMTYDVTSGMIFPGPEMEALHGANLFRQFGLPSGQRKYSSSGVVDWALDPDRDTSRKWHRFRARQQ